MSANPLDRFSLHNDSDPLFMSQDHTNDIQTEAYLRFIAEQDAKKKQEVEEQARELAKATGTLFIDPAMAKDLHQPYPEFTD